MDRGVFIGTRSCRVRLQFEPGFSSKTSVSVYRTTLPSIPEDHSMKGAIRECRPCSDPVSASFFAEQLNGTEMLRPVYISPTIPFPCNTFSPLENGL
jgi:hypothetical protein